MRSRMASSFSARSTMKMKYRVAKDLIHQLDVLKHKSGGERGGTQERGTLVRQGVGEAGAHLDDTAGKQRGDTNELARSERRGLPVRNLGHGAHLSKTAGSWMRLQASGGLVLTG